MILFIDTADFNSLRLGLIRPAQAAKELRQAIAYNESYKTAGLIEKFLRKAKIKPSQLKKIVVCAGPGSFTGIRVGVALAQALGFGLNIPVVAIKKSQIPTNLRKLETLKGGKQIILDYGKPPNITKPKK